MNDPNFEKVYYHFITEKFTDKFDRASPLQMTQGDFEIELDKGMLTVTPLKHFPDVESAKAAIEPMLRSWESSTFLSHSRFRIHFRFHQADVIDRNPTPDNTTINVHSAQSVFVAGTVTVTREMNCYPAPSKSFVSSQLTDELIYRLQQYIDGREPLPTVAYYVLERLERVFVPDKVNDTRKELGKILNVEFKVLDNLGKISNKHDSIIGRHAGLKPNPITQMELGWLDEVVFRLVERVGEINASPISLPTIGMRDFSSL